MDCVNFWYLQKDCVDIYIHWSYIFQLAKSGRSSSLTHIWILKQCHCATLTCKLWSASPGQGLPLWRDSPPSVKIINTFPPPFRASSATKKNIPSHLKLVRDIEPDETSTSQRVHRNFIHMTAIKCHLTAIKCNVTCKLPCSYMPKVSNVKLGQLCWSLL